MEEEKKKINFKIIILGIGIITFIAIAIIAITMFSSDDIDLSYIYEELIGSWKIVIVKNTEEVR